MNYYPFLLWENIHPWRIISNYSHIYCVESAGFFAGIVKTRCCQFVCTPANHVPCISKVPLYCVCIHCSWVYFLEIFNAEYLNCRDVAKQQWFNTKPSLIRKKIILWGAIFAHHLLTRISNLLKVMRTSGSLIISPSFWAVFQYVFMANARADQKLPEYPPLHFFNGAVEHAKGSNDGGGNNGKSVQSFNPQVEADFLFRGVPPLQGDEKLGGAFSSEAMQTSNSFAFAALSKGGVTMGREQSRQSRLTADAIAADALSAANALAADAFAAAAAASTAASASVTSPAFAVATAAVIPFLHCANKYSPWNFDRLHGPSHCFTFAWGEGIAFPQTVIIDEPSSRLCITQLYIVVRQWWSQSFSHGSGGGLRPRQESKILGGEEVLVVCSVYIWGPLIQNFWG